MPSPPSGTVTFLFSDIESSTVSWERHPDAMKSALARHEELLRSAIEAEGGYIFKTMGDACCAAFNTAREAVRSAAEAQQAIAAEQWEGVNPLRVRMALNTGAAEERGRDYFGTAVNRVARILSTGHGGQTLLAQVTADLVQDVLPDGLRLRDLGQHRLKDLSRPERIYQLLSPGLSVEFPPLRSLETRPNNLPIQPTSLVGREREIDALRKLLLEEDARLVTLTGPGGSGKTRLALQVAAELVEGFADGVFFVGLGSVADPELLAPTINQTLGAAEATTSHPTDILKDHLRDKRMLLVLDNFEQLLSAAPLVAELLGAAPILKVLVTSRAGLHLRGEREFPVPPLAVPDAKRLPSLETLSQFAAVSLFIERALAVRPSFAVTNENAPAVAEICAKLDGLPLAIELAAARVKLLPPEAMLTRLESRLKLLTGGARDLPARQQTLRGAIAWSHELLGEKERKLFRRLSVFVGGCTLETAEMICGGAGDLALDVFEGMASLVDENLLRQEETTGTEPRFVMLETIREFALEMLVESGEGEDTRRTHAVHYLDLAERARGELWGADQLEWFARLEAEHDNLRAALRWCQGSREAEMALRMTGGLWQFWWIRGYWYEGRTWLEQALDLGSELSGRVRKSALAGAGAMAWAQDDYARATRLMEESLELERELGNTHGVADALSNLAAVASEQGDYTRAMQLIEESLSLRRELDDRRGIAVSLGLLGSLASHRAEYARAREHLEESLALHREYGNRQGAAMALRDLGATAHRMGQAALARELCEEALGMFRELDDKHGIASSLNLLADLMQHRGEHARALRLHAQALETHVELGHKSGISTSLIGLAEIALVEGEAERAARLLGGIDGLRELIGIPLALAEALRYDRCVAAAREALAAEAFQSAIARGRRMKLDQMLAENAALSPAMQDDTAV
jgi:predicted ATPase/class 3 adenylate cyclase